jgi:hypothetical protein
MRAMIEAMVDAHASDPELYDLLHDRSSAPHRGHAGLRGPPSRRVSPRHRIEIGHELKTRRDLDMVVFIVTHMVDALSHGAVLRRPAKLSLAAAKEEAVRAILAYLRG